MGAVPDYNGLLGVLWGDEGYERNPIFSGIALASNVQAQSNNPPYTINDFLSIYPAFFGAATSVTGALTIESNLLMLTVPNTVIAIGDLVTIGSAIPDGTTITGIDETQTIFTLSNNATATVAAANALVYTNPPIPLVVIQLYINLAGACIYYNRYFDSWQICMGLFVAHYLTMWAQANQFQGTQSIAQIAAAGLAIGIKTSKHAGNVGLGQRPLDDLIGWGTFQLTLYGQQFASIAKVLGSGNMFLY